MSKCDTCVRKLKNSNGQYVRCAKRGNIKKRAECVDYADKIDKVVVGKVDMLAWCD